MMFLPARFLRHIVLPFTLLVSRLMRFLVVFCFLLTGSLNAQAQFLPDSLRPTVEIALQGDEVLLPLLRQQLELNLIGAEAVIVEEAGAWRLQIQMAHYEPDVGLVALSMIVSQPNVMRSTPKPLPSDTEEIESGDWVKDYLKQEYEVDLRKILQHEVVFARTENLDAGVRELVSRFKTQHLDAAKEVMLQRMDQH